MRTARIIKDYLNDEIIHESITGGGEAVKNGLEDQVLKIRIEKNSSFNNKMIVFYMILLGLSLVLLCLLILNYLDSQATVLALVGGEGLSIGLIIRQMHRIYRDKIFSDQILYMLPKLTTEKERLYYLETLSSFLK